MQGLRAAGWTVEFACADGPFAAQLRAEGFHHRRIPMTRKLSPLRQLLAVAALAASLVRHRADLVHTHTPVGGIVGRAAALIARSPSVHTFHGLPLRDPTRPSLVERAFLVVERALARGTRAFFSQASADVDVAVALGIARRDRTLVIGNGVDIARFAPRADLRERTRAVLGIGRDAVLVITVARLVREKGQLDLADAVVRLAHDAALHVVLIGDALPSDRSDIRGELEAHEAARRLGQRWQLLGHRSDVVELLNAADIFVLPSHREGLPRSVIEAMAVGLPIVATDIPACRELVSADNGVLVPVGDPPALAEALAGLVGDAAKRRAFGERSRQLALERHDERKIVALQVTELESAARR